MTINTRLEKLEAEQYARDEVKARAFADWIQANATPEARDSYWRVHLAVCIPLTEHDGHLQPGAPYTLAEWLKDARALFNDLGGAVLPGDIEAARRVAEHAPGEWRLEMISLCDDCLQLND